MTKPTYRYPDFISKVELESSDGKRYWLSLTIDTNKSEDILVILKNPSRAHQSISDKTVYNVSNYIFRNRKKYPALNQVGRITILNLMPHYLTDSTGLKNIKSGIIDKKNLEILNAFCAKTKKVIIAWGNHPKGLLDPYETLKKKTISIIETNKNEVFYVKRLTKAGNPTHGQVWSYKDNLLRLDTGH